jgi:hypothetical protein
MIEATSGKPFEEKVKGEFGELEGEMQTVYAMVAVASAFRFFLTKQDILLGQDEATNEVLNAISRLVQRQIIICEDDTRFMARHRVIADLIFSDLAQNGTVAEVFLALARAAALQITQGDSPNTRHRRLIRRLMSHELLKTAIGFEEARYFYSSIEPLLSNEPNFWLHRGSLEVEQGNLNLAENFLNQARALDATDMNIQTEYAYLLFRKALQNPAGTHAEDYVTEARALLDANIGSRGDKDPHSYHVLGSNMLEWAERGIADRADQKIELETLSEVIEQGCKKHRFSSTAECFIGELLPTCEASACPPDSLAGPKKARLIYVRGFSQRYCRFSASQPCHPPPNNLAKSCRSGGQE